MPEYAPFDLPEPDPQTLAGLPHLRRFQPAPGLWAWYDGRVPGYRAYPQPNWIDGIVRGKLFTCPHANLVIRCH